jgi:hypothetical protein
MQRVLVTSSMTPGEYTERIYLLLYLATGTLTSMHGLIVLDIANATDGGETIHLDGALPGSEKECSNRRS